MESIKYMGEDVTPRASSGRYTFKSRIKYLWKYSWYRVVLFATWMWKLTKIAAVSFAVLSVAILGGIEYGRGDIVAVAQTAYGDETGIAKQKAAVMHELSVDCETQGYKAGDDAIIMDTNNQLSVGPFKYQIKTMQQYYPKVYNKTITRAEAVTAAMDYDVAEKVAEYVWFETSNGPKEWVNCNKWHDIAGKVALIKTGMMGN